MTLAEEIESTEAATPSIWWLGHSGFVIKYQGIVFCVDPTPGEVFHADLLLCTHPHEGHMNPAVLRALLAASPSAKVVMPKSAAAHANSIGIPYERMTTTDSGLRVEYFKQGLYGRVYSVPSAHPGLDWTPIGGYPYLGYLIRFGPYTIYHAGDCCLYDGIVDRLRPYNVTLALLPIDGEGNFSVPEAAQLAEDIGAKWIVPMHYPGNADRFVDHILGFHPSLGFKALNTGKGWRVPE